ncbi:hypothetical protein GCM10010472_20160 [Pseudonocardia halophobica]|uniref:Branched-chain amino acid transport system permease protein n=1 Tax=Pseudonocardia halophobica TaxID=29401 RepID=A0A9W6L067_9PSEU|nr:branched-chain amino acid ABC transporter permease [Pseudonocardia halophobica]GLL09771.1 hypothetical protein GCM10017577_09110 [Pseudonocardia halophobica]
MSVPTADRAATPLGQVDAALRRMVSVSTGRGNLLGLRHATLLSFAVLVLVVGLTGSANTRYGLVFSTVYAIVILGNNAIAATLQEINLSGGAFLAIGAYTAVLALDAGWNVLLAMLAAMLVAAIIGMVFAFPTTRLTGLATALVTFTLAFSILDLANYLGPLTGGDQGKQVSLDATLVGMRISGSRPGMLILTVLVMVVVGLAHLWLLHRRPGRIAIAVGEAEFAASVFGTNIRLVKVAVWTWAAGLGGLAGALYSLSVGYVSSTQWPIMISILVFVGGLIGGTRSATGAWIGGIVVGGLPLWLQKIVPATASSVLFGVIIVLALLAGGKGIAEFGERTGLRLWGALRRKTT